MLFGRAAPALLSGFARTLVARKARHATVMWSPPIRATKITIGVRHSTTGNASQKLLCKRTHPLLEFDFGVSNHGREPLIFGLIEPGKRIRRTAYHHADTAVIQSLDHFGMFH